MAKAKTKKYKIKTHKATSKRFRLTGSGKLVRTKGGKSHFRRRRGHNESDEPAFTQPLMYQKIRQRETVREAYLGRLIKLGEITRERADEIAEERRQVLEAGGVAVGRIIGFDRLSDITG